MIQNNTSPPILCHLKLFPLLYSHSYISACCKADPCLETCHPYANRKNLLYINYDFSSDHFQSPLFQQSVFHPPYYSCRNVLLAAKIQHFYAIFWGSAPEKMKWNKLDYPKKENTTGHIQLLKVLFSWDTGNNTCCSSIIP